MEKMDNEKEAVFRWGFGGIVRMGRTHFCYSGIQKGITLVSTDGRD